MATIQTRYSDNGRTNVLSKTAATAQADSENGQTYVQPETVQRVTDSLETWTLAVNKLNALLSKREKEVREKNESFNFLDIVLRDMWEVVKRRTRRMGHPAEVLTYYALPMSGVVPGGINEKNMLAIGEKIIQGDVEAVKAGYPAMVNPAVEELAEAINKAKKEMADVAPSDRAYDLAVEDVENLRAGVDELIADIIAELKFNLRKKDPPSQRRIIRSYGIELIYNKSENTQDDSAEIDLD